MIEREREREEMNPSEKEKLNKWDFNDFKITY